MTDGGYALLPCPFCGGAPKHEKLNDPEGSWNWGGEVISCTECLASTAVVFPLKQVAGDHLILLWNRRRTDPAGADRRSAGAGPALGVKPESDGGRDSA